MDPSGREEGLVYCTEAWRPAPRRAVGVGAALFIAWTDPLGDLLLRVPAVAPLSWCPGGNKRPGPLICTQLSPQGSPLFLRLI